MIEPTLGMDGRTHTSLSSYRASLRAESNPYRQNYTELGDQSLKPVTYDFDKKQRREEIKKAVADVKNGRIPAVA